jgi:hypothetical protein
VDRGPSARPGFFDRYPAWPASAGVASQLAGWTSSYVLSFTHAYAHRA